MRTGILTLRIMRPPFSASAGSGLMHAVALVLTERRSYAVDVWQDISPRISVVALPRILGSDRPAGPRVTAPRGPNP
jgi:hypothetical protein